MSALPELDAINAEIARLMAIARTLRAKRHEPLIERVRQGTPIKDLGLPYPTAFQIVRAHEKKTGERLPRSPRGPKHKSARTAEIVAAYKQTPNAYRVGERFGITHQRVTQIVLRHERETGERLERGKAAPRYGPRVERVVWRCHGCGTERRFTPGTVRAKTCQKCTRTRTTDVMIEAAISERLAGAKWYPLAMRLGWSQQGSFQLSRIVYVHLLREGQTDMIPRLWPDGVPPWLQKHGRRYLDKDER